MRILCYGSKGWIGTQMQDLLDKRGHTVLQGNARLDDYKVLCAEIDGVQPDYVFSSAGRTHGTHSDGRKYETIDFLELPGNLDVNLRDNFIGPMNLARICEARKIICGYIGTGCIFEYDKTHCLPSEFADEPSIGFTEKDEPNFKGSGYSIVKGWTDKQMHLLPDTVCNWRIRMPISKFSHSRDFITKICNYGKIAKVCSVPNSMTVLSEILPIMVDMIERKITGTWNMCNPGIISHNQILFMYQKEIDSNYKFENFTVEEQSKILKAGRSNNYLDTTMLQDYAKKNNLMLSNIHDAIAKTFEQRKQKSIE